VVVQEFVNQIAVEADIHKGKIGEEEVHGVSRCGSELMTKMMSAFPATVTMYIHRKSQKRTCHCPGSLVMSNKGDTLTPISFSSPLGIPLQVGRSLDSMKVQNWIKIHL
jgi:hypothetical protein